MADYASLTPQQKALVQNWQSNLRALMGELGRVKWWSDIMAAQYNQEINTLSLTGDIPNGGGLSGSSVEETYTQLQTWQSYLSTFVTNLGSSGHVDQYTSAAGPDNIVGGNLV